MMYRLDVTPENYLWALSCDASGWCSTSIGTPVFAQLARQTNADNIVDSSAHAAMLWGPMHPDTRAELVALEPLLDSPEEHTLPELHDAGTLHSSPPALDRKSTRLNSSHSQISYAVFCLKKKK